VCCEALAFVTAQMAVQAAEQFSCFSVLFHTEWMCTYEERAAADMQPFF
jgi:hypothetical protein